MKFRTVILICISFGLGIFISFLYIKFSEKNKISSSPNVSWLDSSELQDLVPEEVLAGIKKAGENLARAYQEFFWSGKFFLYPA